MTQRALRDLPHAELLDLIARQAVLAKQCSLVPSDHMSKWGPIVVFGNFVVYARDSADEPRGCCCKPQMGPGEGPQVSSGEDVRGKVWFEK